MFAWLVGATLRVADVVEMLTIWVTVEALGPSTIEVIPGITESDLVVAGIVVTTGEALDELVAPPDDDANAEVVATDDEVAAAEVGIVTGLLVGAVVT